MKQTYQVIMTKVYEVKVEAESREQAEEIFDNFGDWEELLRVHTLDVLHWCCVPMRCGIWFAIK